MSRNLNDWMAKEPVKGNRYKLWKLFPGSVFTISTPLGPTPLKVMEQKGTLTKCDKGDGTTFLDSSVEVVYIATEEMVTE